MTILTRVSSKLDQWSRPRVAVLGGFRCGTNYLKYLLEVNYRVSAEFSTYGWKHAGVPVLNIGSGLRYPQVPIVYSCKNPYAFAVSLYQFSQLGDGMIAYDHFDLFLRSPLVMSCGETQGSPQLRFQNPIQYWNYLYWNLESLPAERFTTVGVNYEDLIADTGQLQVIADAIGFKRRRSAFATPTNKLHRVTGQYVQFLEKHNQTTDEFDASYYVEKRYLNELTSEQVEFISAEVDPWVMTRRGYTRL